MVQIKTKHMEYTMSRINIGNLRECPKIKIMKNNFHYFNLEQTPNTKRIDTLVFPSRGQGQLFGCMDVDVSYVVTTLGSGTPYSYKHWNPD